MKDVGIVGVPYSGKTTLFSALTQTGSSGGRSNQAVVDVFDERVDILTQLEHSKKPVYAKVRFVDVPGGLTAQGIGEYRQTDALCLVVRAFGGGGDPVKELSMITSELLLADLASIESSYAKLSKKARTTRDAVAEVAPIERAHSILDSERLLHDEQWDEAELRVLKGYGPLTLKPWIVVANVDEGGAVPDGLPPETLAVSAALEAEVAGMDGAEAAELLGEFGVQEPGLARVIGAGYRALDLITFLTSNEDESRAWEVHRGATAPEAAGVIHSDLQRGFIRAEVVTFQDLVEAGSWAESKSRGLLRVEGKDYVVEEGDVISVRFAI
jgi:GTP-binding protein YchF